MKNRDMSVFLKNVSISDTGTYKCRIIVANIGSDRTGTEFTYFVNLTVADSGDVESPVSGGAAGDTWEGGTTDKRIKDGGNKDVNVGLVVGLLVFVVLVSFVAFMIIRKRKCVKESFYQLVSQRTVKQPEV